MCSYDNEQIRTLAKDPPRVENLGNDENVSDVKIEQVCVGYEKYNDRLESDIKKAS